MSSIVKSLHLNSVRKGVKSRILVTPPLMGKECMESFSNAHFERRVRSMRSSTSEASKDRTWRSIRAGKVRLEIIKVPDTHGL